ncbi:hypothetical protein [Pseudomonas aeruginosa]|uniref:hypothetical protein n=1 Tax=Pseudomonas aeruginosa TaxID=287 RepID=UPI001911A047|nr:hypothetical protein [Pseudomonas aeruginosa]MDI2418332.1 hypothetical protein [Pseudomonas aeruginosa]MDI2448778.1 hypothetical protein [Pseudomonas aeruginosa]MDV8040903.1 hypothetical protein [Pseudomonas aeruginosa]GLF22494.1 hypothetical protein VNPA131463_33270 [Pseudomonas aeruginosa]
MTNELTDVRCPCGAEFQADSYDAGFIAGSGMCQNCDAALPPKDICTCPSGDGSLRHPCPEHPAVEQAGGDERKLSDLGPEGAPVIGCLCGMPMTEGHHSPDGCCNLEEFAPQAQAEQAEAERPEVVAWQYRVTAGPQTGWSLWHPGKGEEFERSYTVERRPLMTVDQHDRIVGELRAVIAQLRQHKNDYMDSGQETYRALQNEIREREAEIARLDGLVSGRTAERDAALARVAELEKQEPVAYVLFRDGEVYYETDDNIVISNTQGDETDLYRWLPVFTAPAAQAQQLHDLDKQCRDEVARALGLRPSQERGFAWSYLLASIKSCVKASEDAAQAQHSVPEGWMRVPIEPLLNMMSDKDHDTRIMAERQLLAMLAAAPGKEGL